MFNKHQLLFIKASLTAKGTAVSTENDGAIAKLFLHTLDEVSAQLRAIEAIESIPVTDGPTA